MSSQNIDASLTCIDEPRCKMLHIPCQLLRRLSCAVGSTFEVSVAPSVSAFHNPISLGLRAETPSGLTAHRVHLMLKAPDTACVSTRCRLVQLQHAEAVWLHLLPALYVPQGKQVPNQKNSALNLHIIHNEACIIVPELRCSDQNQQVAERWSVENIPFYSHKSCFCNYEIVLFRLGNKGFVTALVQPKWLRTPAYAY